MNDALRQYDDIRPFEPEELPEVFDRLIANEQFRSVVTYLFPNVPFEMLAAKMKQCKTNLEFEKAFVYGFLHDLLKKVGRGMDADFSAIDLTKRYTFMSNHRDIVLDPSLLDVCLVDAGCDTTAEIAIGDNLLSLPWVKDMVRVCKAFIIKRGLPMREMLVASKQMSEYIHCVITEKNDNVWIAHRAGRAKDSDDRTAVGVLKMLAMGKRASIVESLKELHIVPTTISYEYDPCDYLKAAELQQKRDDAGWKKGPMDDIISMQTGIQGFKGHIHYHAAPCIDEWLDTLPADMPKEEQFAAIAAHMDREIHSNYMLYPCNYIALDKLNDSAEYAAHYSDEDKAFFDKYLAGQLAKIEIPNRDDAFLTETILKMYANPAINYLAAIR